MGKEIFIISSLGNTTSLLWTAAIILGVMLKKTEQMGITCNSQSTGKSVVDILEEFLDILYYDI